MHTDSSFEPDRFLANIIDVVIILLHFHFQVPSGLPYICQSISLALPPDLPLLQITKHLMFLSATRLFHIFSTLSQRYLIVEIWNI